jgi:large subunit ribosomal protein L7/L12
MANTEQIVEQLSGLTVLEIADLVKKLEEKWGVSAAAPVAIAAGPVAGGGAAAGAPAVEEKTTFDVILKEIGGNKIAVIKEVRAAKRKPWSKALPSRSKKESPKKKRKRSRRRLKPLEQKSKSNKPGSPSDLEFSRMPKLQIGDRQTVL